MEPRLKAFDATGFTSCFVGAHFTKPRAASRLCHRRHRSHGLNTLSPLWPLCLGL